MTIDVFDKEAENLIALKFILNLTDESDWHLIHNTARKYVAEGKLSKEGERKYKDMVNEMLKQREEEK